MDSEASDNANDGQQNSHCPPTPFCGYAGFWKRYAAAFIDGVILFFAIRFVFFLEQHLIFPDSYIPLDEGIDIACLMAIPVVTGWLYFALFERASIQATPGKLAVGIKVTDMNGDRISFGRASGRYFGKILSTLSFLIGYIMVAFSQNKQGLHDIVAECLVVNKSAPTRVKTAVTVAISVIVTYAFLYTAMSGAKSAGVNPLAARAKDIYVAIVGANTEREPLGLGTAWPKSGNQMEDADDIGKMTFENSSDYFSVLMDSENYGTENWRPYVSGLKWENFAGAGVPSKRVAGRLTAKNNAWTIAANIPDDLPDIVPVIISRNVDPESLIPREGDLSQQYIRLSEQFKTPYGKKGFVMVRTGGGIYSASWKYANLKNIYHGTSEEELQGIREAFQKIKYLTP